jgi:hypothetical protein
VVCDGRINTEETLRLGKVNLAFGFAASKPGEYHAFLVTHSPGGSRTRPITVNRFANYSPSVDLEIESSILRGLVPMNPAEDTAEGDTVRMPQPVRAEPTRGDTVRIERPEHGDTVVLDRPPLAEAEK